MLEFEKVGKENMLNKSHALINYLFVSLLKNQKNLLIKKLFFHLKFISPIGNRKEIPFDIFQENLNWILQIWPGQKCIY